MGAHFGDGRVVVMTSPGVLEVVELDEALDFEPGCDIRECESVAAWSGTLPCCGRVLLRCDAHRRSLNEAIAGFVEAGGFGRHVGNGACLGRVYWVRWEPLKGGR